jgi:uncharacterized protein
MRFVDANVFIYEIVQSPEKDFRIANNILERIEKGEEAATSLAVIQEVIDWLQYNKRRQEVESFLLAINSYMTLTKLSGSWNNFVLAIEYMNKRQTGFVDSLNLQIMRENKISEIYSNDKDFDRVDWVKRIWK